MRNIRDVVADNIRRYRKQNNISQEELALRCGLHRTYISDVERSNRNVTIESLQKIADALGVPPYMLLVGYEDQ